MSPDIQQTLVISAVSVWAMQALKSSKYFPWLTHETEQLNRIFSAFLASVGSAGILFTVANQGAGSYNVSIKGLTLMNVAVFLYHAVANYATQKGLFKLYTINGNGKAASSSPEPLTAGTLNAKLGKGLGLGA